jgi:hypothetical protein
MARKPSALASIFDDEATEPAPVAAPVADAAPEPAQINAPRREPRSAGEPTIPARRSSHPGKKPVLIHIPEDMHRALRQLSVEEGGEPLTVITERLLRQYLVKRGHTRFAP